MNMEKSPAPIDTLLEPLLLETSEAKVDEILQTLITVHAASVIKGVIRHKLRLSTYHPTQGAEADDIYQEVVLQLISQLQRFRKNPNAHPITDVRGMAAVIAHRACSRWMRRQFPERHALKNRLHYLLTRQRGLAIWQEHGKLVAGFVEWQGQRRRLTEARLEREGLPAQLRDPERGKQQNLPAVVAAVFNYLGKPIEFDELVSALAELMGIRDQPVESLAGDEETVTSQPAAGQSDPAWQVEKRTFLQRLWEELKQLPLNQRAALLLNLKDPGGSGCITLFPATGIASLRQLAETLELNVDSFAKLWNDLPIEDARIAELLHLTRQQVINARKSGRERLARRLKGFM